MLLSRYPIPFNVPDSSVGLRDDVGIVPYNCDGTRTVQRTSGDLRSNGSDSIHIPGRDASEIGEGLSRGLKTCHRHVFLTPFWYARRDSLH